MTKVGNAKIRNDSQLRMAADRGDAEAAVTLALRMIRREKWQTVHLEAVAVMVSAYRAGWVHAGRELVMLGEEDLEASGLSPDEQMDLLFGAAVEDQNPAAALSLVYRFGRLADPKRIIEALAAVKAGSAEAVEILEEIDRGGAEWLNYSKK